MKESRCDWCCKEMLKPHAEGFTPIRHYRVVVCSDECLEHAKQWYSANAAEKIDPSQWKKIVEE